METRLCHSKARYHELLKWDIEKLMESEKEYLYYLDSAVDAIVQVVIKTQSVVRGFLARQRLKKNI